MCACTHVCLRACMITCMRVCVCVERERRTCEGDVFNFTDCSATGNLHSQDIKHTPLIRFAEHGILFNVFDETFASASSACVQQSLIGNDWHDLLQQTRHFLRSGCVLFRLGECVKISSVTKYYNFRFSQLIRVFLTLIC